VSFFWVRKRGYTLKLLLYGFMTSGPVNSQAISIQRLPNILRRESINCYSTSPSTSHFNLAKISATWLASLGHMLFECYLLYCRLLHFVLYLISILAFQLFANTGYRMYNVLKKKRVL